MTVLKYYIEEKFNPVPITFFNTKNVKLHFEKRKNLIENHLKIPLFMFKGKDVLEFGCNGAENACVLANYGANIYLVEPNIKMHSLIKKNFKKVNKKNKLKLVSSKNLENFKINKKFDFVIAEGFLNTLVNREKYFKKLISFLNFQGSLIINYDDNYGVVFEFIKSIILLKACELKKTDFRGNHALKIAKYLFYKEFRKLKSSRKFSAWFKDQLVNPYASKVWSLKDILKLCKNTNLYLYSTSPIFDDSKHFKWYKNVNLKKNNIKDKNNLFLKSWKKNFNSYIFNNSNLQKTKINNITLKDLEKFVKQIGKFIFIGKINKKLIEPKKFLKYLEFNGKKKLSIEIKKTIKYINSCKSERKLYEYYNSTTELKKTWGSAALCGIN